MGIKSRGNFAVMKCLGCIDAETDRCDDCLGRAQDKRKKNDRRIDREEEQ
jgi:hypothetical protein